MATNLLPPNQVQELNNEKIKQKVTLILILILIDLLVLIAIVFGLYFYVSQDNTRLSKEITQKEQLLKEPQSQEIKKIIEVANQNLNKINNIKKDQVSPVDVLDKLNELVPRSAYLKVFSFQNGISAGTNVTEVLLNGVADTRETVFLFKKLLSQDKAFQSVYFEPSSWVKPTNASFAVNFKFVPEKK